MSSVTDAAFGYNLPTKYSAFSTVSSSERIRAVVTIAAVPEVAETVAALSLETQPSPLAARLKFHRAGCATVRDI